MKRLCAVLLLAAASMAILPDAACAETWPARPVRIVNTFAAGGAADVLARIVADDLSAAFRQQFYVETRAGASGTIGVQAIVHSPPDGYHFVVTSLSALAIAPTITPKVGYDPLRDLTPVAYLAGSPIAFEVNAKGTIKSLSDFLAAARQSAKPLTYSTSGLGSVAQAVTESFAQTAKIKFEHIPYKGASQGLADLIGGHIVFSAQTVSSASAFVQSGTLLLLAHSGQERLADYPDVPTFRELGYPNLVTTNWFALLGPAGLPRDIVASVNHAVVAAMSRPEAQERLHQIGLQAQPLSPEAFAALIVEETERWKPVIEQLGPAVREAPAP
jgi:tripartite-type tricarboxylate transporter receptor subunit TctC